MLFCGLRVGLKCVLLGSVVMWLGSGGGIGVVVNSVLVLCTGNVAGSSGVCDSTSMGLCVPYVVLLFGTAIAVVGWGSVVGL